MKFSHGVGKLDLIKDGWCCEWRKLPITILMGGEVGVVALAKSRSGLVLVFYLVEWKELLCLES